ncbi:phosphate uptake regulator PhoU [uncultured Methanospirillum sp.]|uniref:PhoU domain-containing protein n=1 Tax=uncultured Methanospirillum sp. TaxID=262503 RepID=UPI0029C9A769|nr:phosphate uptake regulator PhoU [uncultured Methanospirillum sp.]
MQIRKVQTSGNSSFSLSLPKEWIETYEVHKNRPVGVIFKDNGDLLITTNLNGNSICRTKLLEIRPDENPTLFFRKLIGVYISGYNRIEIRSDKPIPISLIHEVRNFIDLVIGFEIVEETTDKIFLCDLISPYDIPVEKLIRRMYNIAKDMQTNSSRALFDNNKSQAYNIIECDQEVDRIYWLLARLTNMIIENLDLCNKTRLSIDEIIHYYQVGTIIERFADNTVLIAKCVGKLDMDHVSNDTQLIIQKSLDPHLPTHKRIRL